MSEAAVDLLREHLRRDAPLRERSLVRFMAAVGAFASVFVLAVAPLLGWRLAVPVLVAVGTTTLLYVALWLALKRGLYHPALPMICVAVEVSVPAVVLAITAANVDPGHALGSPAMVIWGAMITASALRASRELSLAAGLLAALEYAAVHLIWIAPQVPASPPATLSLSYMVFRSGFLLASGGAAALVAGHLLRKSEEALRAVREQDLMGKYVLHERIGSGGMAEVFRATYCPEGGFERTVAVKRILPAYCDDAEFVGQFREEARLGALLAHPNIVQVLDVGRFRRHYFLAMEFIEGSSLQRILSERRTPLPFAAVSYLGAELASALAYAHERRGTDGEPLRLVHRDVNPPNVLVSAIGEVKLSDFGIARAANKTHVTLEGYVKGKADYMAPEQAQGKAIDHRTDLFALGLTLHEALTGYPVVRADTDEEAMQELVRNGVAPPSILRPGIPRELEALVMQLVAREPDARPQSGREVRERLLALTGEAAPLPGGREALVDAVAQVRQGSEGEESWLKKTEQVLRTG